MTSNINVSQNTKARIRRDINAQLTDAVAHNVERGTVTTERGDYIAFTVRYADLPRGRTAFITTKGMTQSVIQDAASVMMHELGYTKF